MSEITRRSLLAGVSGAAILAAVPALARRPFGFPGGGSPSGVAPPTDYSFTVANTGGVATPAETVVLRVQAFAPGDVPAGSIAVPQTAGGVDLPYQADNVRTWGNGSQMLAEYRIITSSIAAGATYQVKFNIRSGSYSNSSAITTATVTSETDLTIPISNCHTADLPMATGVNSSVGLTMSGGAITGGTTHYRDGSAISNVSVIGGGGSGAVVSVDLLGNITVNNPGSGYSLLGGTGAFTASLNSAIAAINSNGNNVNGYYIAKYSQGAVCDGWRMRMPVSGVNHLVIEFYVERYKKPSDGTLLDYKAYAFLRNGQVSTANTIYTINLTYDFKNGSTVLRGASNGDVGYTNTPIYLGAASGTFDVDGKPNWLTNGATFTKIKPRLTSAECLKFRSTGVIPPFLEVTSSRTPPSTHAYYEVGLYGGLNYLCDYRPSGTAGVRAPEGSGGGGNTESIIFELGALHWNAMRLGNYSAADVWEKNGRVAAAHGLGSSQSGGGLFERTTGFGPNCIPASTQTFAGMTPTRESMWVDDIPSAGQVHPIIQNKGELSGGLDVYHQACFAYYPYVTEGERWMLDALTNTALIDCIGANYLHRYITLGAAPTLYGIFSLCASNVRAGAWYARTAGYAGILASDTFADGATNPEAQLCKYLTNVQYTFWYNLSGYTGDFELDHYGVDNKPYDFTGTGAFPELINENWDHNQGLHVPFMHDYLAMSGYHHEWLWQGTATGDIIKLWNDELDNYYIGTLSYPGSHFLFDSYRMLALTGRPPAPAPGTWSDLGGNTTNPQIGAWGLIFLSFTNGSSTVNLTDAGGSPHAFTLYPGKEVSSGARVLMTGSDISGTIGSGFYANLPPAPFSSSTWYYVKRLTSTTWQLCTDAALTSPVTPTADQQFVQFWFIPIAADLPADNAGKGSFNGGIGVSGSTRIAIRLSTIKMRKALRVDGTTAAIDAAITNLGLMNSSQAGFTGTGYEDDQTCAWDSTR